MTMKNSYIGQAWLVILLSLCFGGALAGVQSALSGRIAANKLDETLRQVPQLVPGAARGQAEDLGGQPVYRALDAAGATVGWVAPATGQGFADVIGVLVGVNADVSQITGVYVLEQKETPGLGNFITGADWLAQFKEKVATQPLAVVKLAPRNPNEIQAITGATISSDATVSIVNKTVAALRAALAKP